MIKTQNRNIAIAWFDAFNKHNLDELLRLYSEEAEHYSPKLAARLPETKGLIKGKSALKAWWKDAFDRLPSLQYTCTSLTVSEERVFMEYIREVNNEPDMLVAEVLDIQDGIIIASRVYHG